MAINCFNEACFQSQHPFFNQSWHQFFDNISYCLLGSFWSRDFSLIIILWWQTFLHHLIDYFFLTYFILSYGLPTFHLYSLHFIIFLSLFLALLPRFQALHQLEDKNTRVILDMPWSSTEKLMMYLFATGI